MRIHINQADPEHTANVHIDAALDIETIAMTGESTPIRLAIEQIGIVHTDAVRAIEHSEMTGEFTPIKLVEHIAIVHIDASAGHRR